MWSACGAALLRFPAAAASRAAGTPSLRTRISAVHFHHACGNKRPRILARSSFMSTFHPYASLETGAKQLTLSEAVTRTGVGLHSGEMAELRLAPAAAGDGRYFIVGDRWHPDDRIPATLDNVQETTLSTCLGDGHYRIRTVEHLLSTLEGLGVGNCRIEIRNGTEVSLLDGSASEWVDAIESAGLSIAEDASGASVAKEALVLKEPVTVWQGDSFVAAFPASRTRLTYGIDFSQALHVGYASTFQSLNRRDPGPALFGHVQAIGRQWFTWSPDDGSTYVKDIAPARTFGIFEQINQLQAAGLIKGGSLKNALVCSMEKGWLNPPLRFPEEPCRHKMLDLIGDLALCAYDGHPGLPVAHIVAYKASHSLHIKFGKALLEKGLR